jgi:hypothetical protein
MAVFRVVALCSLITLTDVSEKPAVPIIIALMEAGSNRREFMVKRKYRTGK